MLTVMGAVTLNFLWFRILYIMNGFFAQIHTSNFDFSYSSGSQSINYKQKQACQNIPQLLTAHNQSQCLPSHQNPAQLTAVWIVLLLKAHLVQETSCGTRSRMNWMVQEKQLK